MPTVGCPNCRAWLVWTSGDAAPRACYKCGNSAFSPPLSTYGRRAVDSPENNGVSGHTPDWVKPAIYLLLIAAGFGTAGLTWLLLFALLWADAHPAPGVAKGLVSAEPVVRPRSRRERDDESDSEGVDERKDSRTERDWGEVDEDEARLRRDVQRDYEWGEVDPEFWDDD